MKNYLSKDVKGWLKRRVNITLAVLVVFAMTGAVGYAIPHNDNPGYQEQYNKLKPFLKTEFFKFAGTNAKTKILQAVKELEATGSYSRGLNPIGWMDMTIKNYKNGLIWVDGTGAQDTTGTTVEEKIKKAKAKLVEEVAKKPEYVFLSEAQKTELKKELAESFNDPAKTFEDLDKQIERDKEFAEAVKAVKAVKESQPGFQELETAVGNVSLGDMAKLKLVEKVAGTNPITGMADLTEKVDTIDKRVFDVYEFENKDLTEAKTELENKIADLENKEIDNELIAEVKHGDILELSNMKLHMDEELEKNKVEIAKINKKQKDSLDNLNAKGKKAEGAVEKFKDANDIYVAAKTKYDEKIANGKTEVELADVKTELDKLEKFKNELEGLKNDAEKELEYYSKKEMFKGIGLEHNKKDLLKKEALIKERKELIAKELEANIKAFDDANKEMATVKAEKEKLSKELEEKELEEKNAVKLVTKGYVDSIKEAVVSDIENTREVVKTGFDSVGKEIDKVKAKVDTKADKQDVADLEKNVAVALSTKADTVKVVEELNKKASKSQVNRLAQELGKAINDNATESANNTAEIVNLKNKVAKLDNVEAGLNKRIDHVDGKLNKVTAMSTAMANVDFQELNVGEVGIGAGIGHFVGDQAVAVGVAYAVDNNLKVQAKMSGVVGAPKYNSVGAGVTYKFSVR